MDNSTELAREMSEAFVWTHSIPNQTPTLIIVSAVFMIITTSFFVARTTVRARIRQWGWDDVVATIAYIIMIVQTSFLFTAARHGFGKHRADIPMMFSTAMFWFWMYQIFYKILGVFTKLTFCLLYLRIFPQKGFQKVVIGVAAIVAAGSFAFMIGTIFQCTPTARNWNKTLPGSCVNFNAFWYSHASFNTFMDIVVFILPIPMINDLNMDRRSKLGLASIFLLGAFTIVASIIRMTELYGSASAQTDPTWGSTTALIWTEVEANTAVICCCLPALRQVAVQAWRRILGKVGPITPRTRSGNQQRLAPSPGMGKQQFGTTADVHHSPYASMDSPGEFESSTNKLWSPGPSNRHVATSPVSWGKMKWADFRRGKQPSTIYEENSQRNQAWNASHPNELGTIWRRQDFRVESERAPNMPQTQPGQASRPAILNMSLNEFMEWSQK